MKALKNVLKGTAAIGIIAVAMSANALNSKDNETSANNPDSNWVLENKTISKQEVQKPDDWIVSEDQPVEIKEFQKEEDILSIYPIPSKDKLFINFKNISSRFVNAEIYDIAGKKVGNDLINNNFSEASINISDLSDGLYILRVTDSGRMINKKFVVRNK